ncbi:MAG: alpha-amylase family glycosyl hydrolase [Phototrophicaceae bacterium]
MPKTITIHFDNYANFTEPILQVITEDKPAIIVPTQSNDFGYSFEIDLKKGVSLTFRFAEKDGNQQEDERLIRYISAEHFKKTHEFWTRGWTQFVYTIQPQQPAQESAHQVVEAHQFSDQSFVSDTGGRFALGATPTQKGILFGIFHPHAARIYLAGDFNNWQHPQADQPNPKQFIELQLHQGYFDTPNIWYATVESATINDAYKFHIEYDSIAQDNILGSKLMVDPYARFLDMNYEENNSIIVDPTHFEWHDTNYQTHAIHDLSIYELHVHGFTHNHPDIAPEHQGTYQGIIDRIEANYFDTLGITCLYLMPISEVPTPQGADALGYNTSLFMSIERDFGTPDDLRRLVDTAHQHGLAVIIDQVFNHSANSWNPLWKHILDHPDGVNDGEEGGIYFSGSTPWGNRMSTERTETQNMLIDACKMMVVEYHIDGFRFDATNSMYMHHDLLHRLADELQALKPNVILIAENLPNETDLNREGYNGYAQWCDFFHDTIKAALREGQFEGTDNHPENLGDIFYFSKGKFAAHTNNVINYCESHDEHSVAHEISFIDNLNTPQAKERKARLGLFSTIVALGQPMLYMGQEFGTDRERNLVYFDFPEQLDNHNFYQWASKLINLRKRYPALKIHGFNPIEDGQFTWILGNWLDEDYGKNKRVLGWRATPTNDLHDAMVILINLENHPVEINVPFGLNGKWVQLASIDHVNDIAPNGDNHTDHESAIRVTDGIFENFTLPDSSGFIYKWEASL